MNKTANLTRRDLMLLGGAFGLTVAAMPFSARNALAAGTVNFADIGVGDPERQLVRASPR